MRVGLGVQAVLALLLAVLPGSVPIWAYPQKNALAPALDSLKLLQAPASAKANRASLKGKVVVLEFWATWCSPCIASLPHFNELVAALDPGRFQFVSIDDEDLGVVQTFLARKKMAGWVGVDAAGRVFAQYGVRSRPTTIILDGRGRVVAVTEIESVTAEALRAVAAGKSVAFKPAVDITEAVAGPESDRSLFSVSVSKAPPQSKPVLSRHPPTGTDVLGQDADSLLTNVLDLFSNRYVLKSPLPEGRFDLRVNTGGLPPAEAAEADAAVQQAVLAALHLKMEAKTLTRPAYVLRATEAARKRLSVSASAHAAKRGCWHGGYVLMNGTMDDLAYVLATGMETPVVNETGIDGRYDARFRVAGGDVESLNAVLRETLGLELVPGGKEMSVTVLEVGR